MELRNETAQDTALRHCWELEVWGVRNPGMKVALYATGSELDMFLIQAEQDARLCQMLEICPGKWLIPLV